MRRQTVFDDIPACTTKEEAHALVEREVMALRLRSAVMSEAEAMESVLASIGYATGYFDRDEAARLLALFETKHPIFGAIEEWPQTPEETFKLGLAMGRASQMKPN
jgi:Zn-dependent protease